MKNVVNEHNLKINEVLKYNLVNYKHCQKAFNYFHTLLFTLKTVEYTLSPNFDII